MKLSRLIWVLLAIVVLTSCGSTNVSAGTPTASPTALPKPTTLHVIRPMVDNFPPLERIIRDGTAVQHLYTSAYALPVPTPGGVVSCPSDIGMVYHMDFLQGSVLLQEIDLDATGCQLLHINRKETRFTNESFRSLFIKIVGIPSLVPGQS